MHDLNTINRLNETSAINHDITKARNSGKHVVASYTGIHLTGFSEHDTADQMLAALNLAREDRMARLNGMTFKALPATTTFEPGLVTG